MSLKDKLASGKFVVTTEVGPPKGVDIQEMKENSEILKGRAGGIPNS